MPITKKGLRRFKKAELVKIAKDNSIMVKKSLSKNVIVDMIFKNKSVRNTLTAPAKKKGTPAQIAARKRFAEMSKKRAMKTAQAPVEKIEEAYPKKPEPLNKQEKKQVKIAVKRQNKLPNPTVGNKPEPIAPPKKEETIKQAKKIAKETPERVLKQDKRKVESEKGAKTVIVLKEDNETKEKGKINETDFKNNKVFQSRAMRNAQKLKRHLFSQKSGKPVYKTRAQTLKSGLRMSAKQRQARALERITSTMKTSDLLDRSIANKQTADHKRRMDEATDRAIHKEELNRNKDIVEIDNELGIEETNPLSKIAELLLARNKERQGQVPGVVEEEKEKTEEVPEEDIVFKRRLELLTKPDLINILSKNNLIRSKVQGRSMLKRELVDIGLQNHEAIQFDLSVALGKRI